MRVARALVIALLIVVAPIQASAERGWVLWVKETKTERAENALRTTVSWGPMTASSSEDACESRLKDQMWKLSGVSETKPPEGEKMYYKLSDGQTLTFLWFRQHRSPDDLPLRTQELSHSCLPDTVDPRGPKVK
jgi:hypothetical protein